MFHHNTPGNDNFDRVFAFENCLKLVELPLARLHEFDQFLHKTFYICSKYFNIPPRIAPGGDINDPEFFFEF